MAVAWGRGKVRTVFELSGNVLEDILASAFYANVALQMDITTAHAFDVSQTMKEMFGQDEMEYFDSFNKQAIASRRSRYSGDSSKAAVSEGMELSIHTDDEGTLHNSVA